MPPRRRILSLWLPHFAAEWRLRRSGAGADGPAFALVEEISGALRLASVNRAAAASGLGAGMMLTDARAIQPDLLTRPAAPEREAAALAGLARWAGRWSPLVAAEPPGPWTGLALDIAGAAHLFGGEAETLTEALEALSDLGFTARGAVADTRGAAWALARHAAGARPGGAPGGDAVAADARATRVRSPRRPRPPAAPPAPPAPPLVVPVGGARAALAPLPVAALRLPEAVTERLMRLGLRRIEELTLTPRAGLARRFGAELVLRLDQALGHAPEPISPLRAEPPLSARISFPEPIGLVADVEAAALRLAERVSARLTERGLGARRLRFSLRLAEGGWATAEIGLARPGRDPARLLALLAPKIAAMETGFGADAARLAVTEAEPFDGGSRRGHFEALAEAEARRDAGGGEDFADLLTRIGARIGLERLTRPLPAESHIPEKGWIIAQAAYAAPPEGGWPDRGRIRPLALFPPEPMSAEGSARPPARFRWRGRTWSLAHAEGPERIAPEWWLDDPAWRSGPRDYWRAETECGRRLWLFEALGAERRGEWFAQGEFA
ncbi:MAG: Y-family DNA polymerase [Pikeienuella sp.]|uniref:Y-family DNA polymerase n=1 Tax=Pikeienuella sp. TaxID=2831957 RepID=UPI003918D683